MRKRITKEIKIKFANSFLQHENGFKALVDAGLPKNLELLQKLLLDKYINNYFEKYAELIQIAEGTTKEAHLAKLQELFKIATGEKEGIVLKKVQNDIVTKKIKSINFGAAAKISDTIQKLSGWDEQGDSNIVVDLELGETEVEEEISTSSKDREIKTYQHFKSEGLL